MERWKGAAEAKRKEEMNERWMIQKKVRINNVWMALRIKTCSKDKKQEDKYIREKEERKKRSRE